jgi:hypothetical protein
MSMGKDVIFLEMLGIGLLAMIAMWGLVITLALDEIRAVLKRIADSLERKP